MTDDDPVLLYAERDCLLTEHADIRRRLYEVEVALDRISAKRFQKIQDDYWQWRKETKAK